MVKKLAILFITLTSLELFNFAFLNVSVIKSFQLIGLGFMFLIIVISVFYSGETGFPKKSNIPIFLILGGVLLSMLTAQWGHNQPYITTLIAQRFMYFYFMYWALHSLKIETVSLEDIILLLGITFSLFYLVQFFLYPTILFDVRIAEDRGTIRIFLPGFAFLVLSYFMVLSKMFEDFTPGKLFSALLFLTILILMGTRQVIVTVALMTLIFILTSKMVKSRILIFTLAILASIPLVILFQDIFISLIDLSKNQSETIAENVRVRAAAYFLTQLFPDNFAYFSGNGADSSNSGYGQSIQMYKDLYGFYQSDIGLIGDYTKFGALFVIGVFWILFRTMFGKMSPQFSYIRYFYISTLLTLFTGGGPFGMADSIVAICFTLYLLDVDKYERQYSEVMDESEEDEVINETYQKSAFLR